MQKVTKSSGIIIALTTLAGIAALLLFAGYKLPFAAWTMGAVPSTPVSLTAVPLGTMPKPQYIVRRGSVENSSSLPVSAGFSGLLTEIYVTKGQAVKTGQPLLKIQASSETYETAGSSPQAQANYDQARKEFNRYQELYEIGAIARRQLDLAAARLQEAKENLDRARNTAGAPPNGAATINAPTDGLVTGISAAPGNTVQPGQPLLLLGSGQEVEVIVQLEQNDLYLVPLGTPVAIEAAPHTIAGKVSRIYPHAAANQTPVFLAHIKLINNPSGLLQAGMSVNVRINTGGSVPVNAVPTASVLQDGQGRNFVYIASGGKAVIRQINIGETIGDYTEITSGLPAQCLVITSNLQDIKDGDAVTVLQ